MVTATKRAASTRRDRRPRRAQGAKAPRSNDYPMGTTGAHSILVPDVPAHVLKDFDARRGQASSRRWVLLRLMERYGKGEVTK